MDSGKLSVAKWRGTTHAGAERWLRFDPGIVTLPNPFMTIPNSSCLGPTDDSPHTPEEDGDHTDNDPTG